MNQISRRCLLLLFSLLFLTPSFAADRYWIASTTSNWNNVTNWSTSSGGIGGASVPGGTDRVFFDANGGGTCMVDITVNIAALNLASNFTGTLDINGNPFNVGGTDNNFFRGGNITNMLNTSTIILNTSGTTLFSGTQFSTPLNVSSGRLLFNGSTFNIASTFNKTGSINDNSSGGNTFTQNMVFTNSSSGHFLMGNGNADVFNGNVTIINNGTSDVYFAHLGTGHVVNGQLDIQNTGTSVRSRIFVASSPSTSLTVNGNTTILQNGSADTLRSTIGEEGDINFNGKLELINSGNGVSSQFFLAMQPSSQLSILDSTFITNNNSASRTNRLFLGHRGDITFNGFLSISNNAGTSEAEVFLNQEVTSTNTYNENIELHATHPNSGGIRFGQGSGSSSLANGKTIAIGTNGFVAGTLLLRNFTQIGATPQSMQLTGTALLHLYDSQWNGTVDFKAPQLLLQGNIFFDTTVLEKNGANDNTSLGGNTFNGNTTIKNSSNNGFLIPANTLSNDFNSTVFYHQSSTGQLFPGFNCTNTYAGNIIVNSTAPLTFGAGTNGRTVIDGNGLQFISLNAGSFGPKFNRLQVNKPSADVLLLTPIEVISELDLDTGHINSSPFFLISMADNAVVSSSGVTSFVNGPIRKFGDDPFTFPVGKNGSSYAPISISAPSSSTDHFTAEYFEVNPDFATPTSFPRTSKDSSLDHISACEYWILDRTGGSSNVQVTLTWDTRSCGVTNLNNLKVARWDGSSWRDHGNGGTTGNTLSGSIQTNGVVTNFSPFTLASNSQENPLPIELTVFDATLIDDVVELEWQTKSEIQNDKFELEKSSNLKEWSTLSVHKGAGNSNQNLNYSTVDLNPLNGITYYRLKQIDFDGSHSYSRVVSIYYDNKEITCYPNPAIDHLKINGLRETDWIQVITIDGKKIHDSHNDLIKTSDWNEGIYFLIVYNNDGEIRARKKILKQE